MSVCGAGGGAGARWPLWSLHNVQTMVSGRQQDLPLKKAPLLLWFELHSVKFLAYSDFDSMYSISPCSVTFKKKKKTVSTAIQ